MGGSVSTGVDNDDLVDNLYAAHYIKTRSVERVFRAVDRAMYFTPLGRESAYKDLAWKNGNIHLSAPCIYSEVMENLSLEPGMSFLNLGSGTGYLSTMAGLILGSCGINHGVEIHHDVIKYAHEKLEEFKETSAAVDEFDFCEPKFVEGNCLQLDSGSMKYDRVYCGAACPPSYESYMKNLLKVGGILVVPLNDRLLRITRVTETGWETRSVLPVAFANLVGVAATNTVYLPKVEPIPLMDACRTSIRNILRAAVDHEHQELKMPSNLKTKAKKTRTLKRIFIPVFGGSENIITVLNPDDESETSWDDSSEIPNSNRPAGGEDEVDLSPFPGRDISRYPLRFRRDPRSSSDSDDSSSDSSLASICRVERSIYQAVTGAADELFPVISDALAPHTVVNSDSSAVQDNSSDSMEVDQIETPPDSSKATPKDKSSEKAHTGIRNKRKEAEMEGNDASSNGERRLSQASSSSSSASEVKESHSTANRGAKREKVDSGISEDINNWDVSSGSSLNSSGENTNNSFKSVSDMDLESDSDSEEEGTETVPRKILLGRGKKRVRPVQDHKEVKTNEYAKYMRSKIQQLPLPQSMKSFINYYREL